MIRAELRLYGSIKSAIPIIKRRTLSGHIRRLYVVTTSILTCSLVLPGVDPDVKFSTHFHVYGTK